MRLIFYYYGIRALWSNLYFARSYAPREIKCRYFLRRHAHQKENSSFYLGLYSQVRRPIYSLVITQVLFVSNVALL